MARWIDMVFMNGRIKPVKALVRFGWLQMVLSAGSMDTNGSIGCWILFHTANEGPVRIQYKCLVPIKGTQAREIFCL